MVPSTEQNKLKFATLNVDCSKRNRSPFELTDDIQKFIATHEIDVLSLTEVDFKSMEEARDFKIENYTTYLPDDQPGSNKVRVIVIAKSALKKYITRRLDLMASPEFTVVWLEINLPRSPRYILGSTYREWRRSFAGAELLPEPFSWRGVGWRRRTPSSCPTRRLRR